MSRFRLKSSHLFLLIQPLNAFLSPLHRYKGGFFQEKFLTHDLFTQPPSLELEDFVNKPSQVFKLPVFLQDYIVKTLFQGSSTAGRRVWKPPAGISSAHLCPPHTTSSSSTRYTALPTPGKTPRGLETDLGFIQTFQPPSTELHDSPNILIQV